MSPRSFHKYRLFLKLKLRYTRDIIRFLHKVVKNETTLTQEIQSSLKHLIRTQPSPEGLPLAEKTSGLPMLIFTKNNETDNSVPPHSSPFKTTNAQLFF